MTLVSNLYGTLRPLLFKFDPEVAHGLAIKALNYGLIPALDTQTDPVLQARFGDTLFEHPLGLAAGFDKHAEVMNACFGLGFSFLELGGVTPVPQPGNARPRVFRLPEQEAIINRFGFNSVGAEVFLERLANYQSKYRTQKNRVLGINLAKNKDTADPADDYVKGVEVFAAAADFLTINVSSPNTPGLRDLQGREILASLLSRALEARAQSGFSPKLFLKIAPDLTEEQTHDIAEVALNAKIDGMIVSNTTVARPATLPTDIAKETGGLSGKPLFDMSTKILGQMYKLTKGQIPLIGVGGIFTGADAYKKIRAGASLLQIYSVMIYRGPYAARHICDELAVLLKRDGFSAVHQATGVDQRP